jgi:hypothetical protein
MLTNILPGLRDFRAPLAAGYLWLLAVYVAFEPDVRRNAQGIWQSFSRLEHTFTSFAIGVGVTFFAYLVGSISQTLLASLVRTDTPSLVGDYEVVLNTRPLPASYPIGPRQKGRFARLVSRTMNSYGSSGEAAITDLARRVDEFAIAIREAARPVQADKPIRFVLEALATGLPSSFLTDDVREALRPVEDLIHPPNRRWGYAHGLDENTEEQLREHVDMEFKRRIVRELRLARTSLLGNHDAIFSEIDRVKSEAEFRGAVAVPLLGLAVAIGWRASAWAVPIGLIAASMLWVSARKHARNSTDLLLEALRLGRATAPSIDYIDQAIKGLMAHENAGPVP